MRTAFLFALFRGLIILFVCSAQARPNMLIILTDDQGYADVSMYGRTDVQTPNIDRLAREGLRFTNMRANATVCSPSRAALLTGMYPDRVGVPGVIRTDPADSWGYFRPQRQTLPEALRQAGYQTACIGKWHLGLTAPNLPNDRGFDFFHGFLGDMMDSYTTHLRQGNNYMRKNRETITPTGHATDLFTQWACDYLHRAVTQAKPFFLYLAYNAPHFPIEPPDSFLARVRARNTITDEKRRRTVALVEHLDANIGILLQTLDALNLTTNTWVVFTSDNGGSLPHGQCNAPWRDGKQSHYDGGLRVPFAMRYPACMPSGQVSTYAGLCFDIYPTALALAGVPLPSGLDATSLVPLFSGTENPATQRTFYFTRREGGHYGGKDYHAWIDGPWKLLQNNATSPFELYNLAADPYETTNLAHHEPTRVSIMLKALSRQIQKGGQTPWQ